MKRPIPLDVHEADIQVGDHVNRKGRNDPGIVRSLFTASTNVAYAVVELDEELLLVICRYDCLVKAHV